jgi:hypothetical protein
MFYMHRGLACSKEILEFTKLYEVVPTLLCNGLPLLQNTSWMTGLHAITCAFYIINDFDSRINLFYILNYYLV